MVEFSLGESRNAPGYKSSCRTQNHEFLRSPIVSFSLDDEDIDLTDVGVSFVDDNGNSDHSDSQEMVDWDESFAGHCQTSPSQKEMSVGWVLSSIVAPKSSEQLLSFDGCEELRRGTRLFTLLHRFGQIFESSDGSSVTYSLSDPVDELDGFVSHNWVVPRSTKFLVLAFHYNVYLAFVVTLVVTTAAGILNILGVLPLVWNLTMGSQGRLVGFASRLVCAPTFLLCILLGSELQYLLGRKGPFLFLDKSCISQTDQALQRLGIGKLGAFVANSHYMIVIYSDAYLRKLWTVFELASFLMVKNSKDLVVLPLEVSGLILVVSWFSFNCHMSETLIQNWWDNRWIQYISAIIGLALCEVTFRVLARKRARILATLEGFTVDAASCAVEADRPQIYSSIHALVAHFHGDPVDSEGAMDEDTALRLFEAVVRERMPRALVKQLGVSVLPFRLLAVATTVHAIPYAWDSLAFVGTSGESAIQIFAYFVSRFSWLLWSPAYMAVGMYLPGLKLHLSGWKEVAWVGLAAFFMASSYCALMVFAELVETDRVALGAALLLDVLLICAGCALLRHEATEQPGDSFSI